MTYSRYLYHGTKNRRTLILEGFKDDKVLSGMGILAYGRGFYFTPSRKKARKFGSVVKVLVTLQNPYAGDFFKRFKIEIITGKADKITNTLLAEGFDGILIKNSINDYVCVFDAKNIKIIA